ncbi:hypothetical protein LCGC14_2185310 [marine sediment metagenome]|uniref:Uncharacterized protein n=1 Tax=marine sediment metagenome TaxID=412755 RepID=A0A0F9DL34_9ZZZZ
MVELELLLLVGIAVGSGIVSTLILGLLTLILVHLKKKPEEEEGQLMFPTFTRPGGQMFSMGDIQRAAAASAAAGEQEEKKGGHKPEGSGGTYI